MTTPPISNQPSQNVKFHNTSRMTILFLQSGAGRISTAQQIIPVTYKENSPVSNQKNPLETLGAATTSMKDDATGLVKYQLPKSTTAFVKADSEPRRPVPPPPVESRPIPLSPVDQRKEITFQDQNFIKSQLKGTDFVEIGKALREYRDSQNINPNLFKMHVMIELALAKLPNKDFTTKILSELRGDK